jgi:hypothetical protein
MTTNRTTSATAAAGLLWLCALLGFGAILDGYSQIQHPVALLGARGMERALAFNALGFVLPGLLAAWAAVQLRGALDGAGWMARIGANLWLLSALAFTAQGVLPLDSEDLDAASSRLHATAWSLWWIAFLPGALMLAWRSRGFAITLVIAAVVVVAAALLTPAGVSQRIAIVAWFVLAGVAGQRFARRDGAMQAPSR